MAEKLYWDKFQWIATALASVFIANFAVSYTGYKLRYPFLYWTLVASAPAVMIFGVATDSYYHWIYLNPSLFLDRIFPELQYDFTWPVFTLAIHGYVVILVSFFMLLKRFQTPGLYRRQVFAIIIGLLIPVLGTLLAIFDVRITSIRDSTPITAAIGNLVIAWAIFRYQLLDVVHIARDTVMDSMSDLVIVLDERDRIVDMNTVALNAIEKKALDVIGKPAGAVFAEWPELIDAFTEPSDKIIKTSLHAYGRTYHHEVKSTTLRSRRGAYVGRVFVSRDISLHVDLQKNLQHLNEDLERRVDMRTAELKEAYDTTLEGWARALELRDKETLGHCWRVTDLTMKLALAMDVPLDQFDHIRRGAILHDIGKMAIPDEILRKSGPLDSQERLIVIQHPSIAYDLLSRIPFLQKALDIPYCHHEKWDGSGYPRGLRGSEIPLAARIFSVVDVWDAVQSERPYKKSWTRPEAIAYMEEQKGTSFDPEIVEVFLALVREGKV